MVLGNCEVAVALLLFLSCSCSVYGDGGDTITTSQPIKDPEAIVSAGNKFKLGFFSPVNSTYRYVGIWYGNISAETQVLWVANRNTAINDSSGMMTISEDGNLVVLNGQGEVLWSSNVSIGFNQSTAQLTDDGNLVLKAGPNGNLVWQSFQHPTDTYIPKMRLSANARTGSKTLLMSWRSSSDPSVGNYAAGVNPLGIPEFFIWYNGLPFWRSGPWDGHNFIGIPGMYTSVYLQGFSVQEEADGIFTLSLNIQDPVIRARYVLTSDGKLIEQYWDYGKGGWEYTWEAQSTECDIYGKCGPFGSCDAQNSPICTCLKGFVPKNQDEWNKGIWTSGCVRMTSLQCDGKHNGSEVRKEDGFMKLEMMKVPTFAEYWPYLSSEQECKDECLKNCSCVAYSYYKDFGCMAWTGNLIDIQKFSEGGTDLNIRLAYTEHGNYSNFF